MQSDMFRLRKFVVLLVSTTAFTSSFSALVLYKEQRFSAMRSADGGSTCALDLPFSTEPANSQIECSRKCQNNGRCLGFNFKDSRYSGSGPLCDLYASTSGAFGVVPYCKFFEVCSVDLKVNFTRVCGLPGIVLHGYVTAI